METLTRDEDAAIPATNYVPIMYEDDEYDYSTCTIPIEIQKIDDLENTIIFKQLNTNEKSIEKIVPISEFLDSMRKYSYLNDECSLCHRKQNKFKDTSIFLYCIKCDTIICPDYK